MSVFSSIGAAVPWAHAVASVDLSGSEEMVHAASKWTLARVRTESRMAQLFPAASSHTLPNVCLVAQGHLNAGSGIRDQRPVTHVDYAGNRSHATNL